MIKVAVVDYGLANIQSAVNALSCFDLSLTVASSGAELMGAERIVLPGVGSFDAGIRGLRERGHIEALETLVRGSGVPFLGICLGMQFLFDGCDEGDEPGFGWLSGRVRRFPEGPGAPKVPHMGWSDVHKTREGRLFAGLGSPLDFYFAHSFYVPIVGDAESCAAATCEHGLTFAAALEIDNLFGVQFHPEKSQLAGLKLIETFVGPA